MMEHTPTPWRWEFNRKSKSLQICGGRKPFDLTVIDFVRWGTNSVIARFREDVNDMNIMHKLSDRADWTNPFEGRAHHAGWLADVNHPDAQFLMTAVNNHDALVDFVRAIIEEPTQMEILICEARALLAKIEAETTAGE